MTGQILDEFLNALHRCWGDRQYAIIGGAALMKYGSERQTSQVDVLVECEKAERLILGLKNNTRFVKTVGIGYRIG